MPYSFSNFYTREEIIYWIISLILNLFLNCGSIKSYCTHVVTFHPKIPIPKLILEIGVSVKHHKGTLPFKYPLKLARQILGGMITNIWTWSGIKWPSIILTPCHFVCDKLWDFCAMFLSFRFTIGLNTFIVKRLEFFGYNLRRTPA